MINSTYQASAMLPIVAQAIMDHFGLTLSNIMLTWTVMVVACIYLCWLFTPTQAEYYQQAKKVLGMPLPKPPKTMKPCDMLSRGVKVLRQHRQEHAVSAICLAFGLIMPLMYSALAAPYGTVLFLGRGWKVLFEFQFESSSGERLSVTVQVWSQVGWQQACGYQRPVYDNRRIGIGPLCGNLCRHFWPAGWELPV